MHLASHGRHLVGGQVDVVGRPGRLAARRGKLIRNGTDHGALNRHGRLQRLGGIMLRRLVHHLRPDRQGERGAVAAGNDGGRLVKSDPHAAGQRAGVAEKPRVFVIVRRAGFSGGREFEAQGLRAGGRPACQLAPSIARSSRPRSDRAPAMMTCAAR